MCPILYVRAGVYSAHSRSSNGFLTSAPTPVSRRMGTRLARTMQTIISSDRTRRLRRHLHARFAGY
jgi:hypothetical protein